MMYIYSLYLFIFGIFLMKLSLIMFLMNYSILINWNLFMMLTLDINYMIYFDWISLSFMSVVLIISSMILIYSIQYMKGDMYMNRFMYLILLFIMSMMLMIMSPNILSILLGWDGLGLISYCLIIYYQNNLSLNAGMITILLNRIGDIGLIILISLLMFNGSWNLFLYNLDYKLMILMLMVAGLTKSAQMPFSSWLPKAMAAPTPVSSLVHSSTLVTAGVYLFFRYNIMITMNMSIMQMILILSSLTMLMSGLMANYEIDLKKIIALSTLSQLALMMSILMLGFNYISYFHLLIHALFKSTLFMCSGMIIHLMNNNQDIRLMGGLSKIFPFLILSFFMCKLSLCGFPFMSGFYSKDLIMELILLNNINILCFLMLMVSTILTVSYTFRLIMFIFMGEFNYKSSNMMLELWSLNLSMIFLFILSICGGSMLMWMFFNINNIIILNLFFKLLIMMLLILGCWLGYLFYLINLCFYYNFFSSMWYLDIIMKYIYKYILNMSFYMFMNMEKGWLEMLSGKGFLKFMMNYKLINNFINLYTPLNMLILMILFYLLIFIML